MESVTLSSHLNASPWRNSPPVSSQTQFPFSSTQPIPLDQDPGELEWRNYTESKLEAILTENPDVADNKAMLLGVKLRPDENQARHFHGSFDLVTNIPKNCIKHLETTIPNSNWCNLEDENSLCNLMSSVQKAWSDLFQADDMQVPPANEMHAGEVIGGTMIVNVTRAIDPKPVNFYKELPAPEKDEKQVEPIQSEKIEVQNAELDSRLGEIVLKSNEVVELKSDPELDVELLHELVCKIYNLQIEIKERREWAQEKALQAAIKVSNNSLELRTLRMKKEIAERMREDIKAQEDKLVQLMDEMEQTVKITQGRAESAQMEITRLEKENREMRAEIEAAKLERSETDSKCNRLEKQLKRINKGSEMSERQMLVLQGEVNKAKKDNAEIEEEIEEVRKEISTSEAKLEEEKKLKDQAVKLVEAESKARISAKNSTQTRLTILTRKMDLDRKRHSEQVKILEREISRLKKANSSSAHNNLAELCRSCISCKAAEVTVVFLPCAHQVFCADCGTDHKEIGSEKCPCCRVRIEERIFVYGIGA